jgi:hypothetical protein
MRLTRAEDDPSLPDRKEGEYGRLVSLSKYKALPRMPLEWATHNPPRKTTFCARQSCSLPRSRRLELYLVSLCPYSWARGSPSTHATGLSRGAGPLPPHQAMTSEYAPKVILPFFGNWIGPLSDLSSFDSCHQC